MKTSVVRVPAPLLLDPDLTASAKLVWMVSRLHALPGPPGPGLLQARSGLSHPTVRTGLARLAAGGWYSPGSGPRIPGHGAPPPGPRVSVPAHLVTDSRLPAMARVLYGAMLLTPGFRDGGGQFTYAGLRALTGASINTIKQAIRDLMLTGWLNTTQVNLHTPIHFSCANPVLARSEAELPTLRLRIEESLHRGEVLMREYLSLLVDSSDYEDDATPAFLRNPWTDERLQLDRFYPPNVAFEFQGPQHFRPTKRFSQRKVDLQRGRDFMKLGMCMTEGVTLVAVLPEDLSLAGMQQKIGSLLPLRELSGRGPELEFLEYVSGRFRASVARRMLTNAAKKR